MCCPYMQTKRHLSALLFVSQRQMHSGFRSFWASYQHTRGAHEPERANTIKVSNGWQNWQRVEPMPFARARSSFGSTLRPDTGSGGNGASESERGRSRAPISGLAQRTASRARPTHMHIYLVCLIIRPHPRAPPSSPNPIERASQGLGR